jgi:hypothetical protein
MRQVGVPEEMIGKVPGDPGAFSGRHAVGGTNTVPRPNAPYEPAINVDPAVLDTALPEMSKVPSWRTAPLRDRVDAVIAHEYHEALTQLSPAQIAEMQRAGYMTREIGIYRHQNAIRQATDTTLKISERAKQILREYREATGLK